MSDEVGRAGFHARHTKAVGERRAIVHEMMRELDPAAIAYWAARNSSIVVADEPMNVALVNDGNGGMRPCTDPSEVIEYGEARLRKVGRKIKEDRLDPKDGKWKGGTITTTAIVCHLPKSMCVEIPDFYPRFHKNGKPMIDPATGEQMRRSRWVARDRAEALRYFADCREYLCSDVVPGGPDALLGEDDQFSESTPHAQYLFDAFAPDPKKPGRLRAAASEAYYSSRNVKDDNGKQTSGRTKFRDYHAGLKAHLIAKGYDISPDFDELRHLTGLGKEEFEASQDAKAEATALVAAAQADHATFEEKRADAVKWLEGERARLDEREVDLDEVESSLDTVAASLESRRANLDDREGRIVAREQEVDQRLQEAEQARQQARTNADALRAQVDRLEAIPADIDRWLDTKAAKDGRTFRDVYDRTAAQRRQRRAETLRIVEQHSRQQTGIDDAQLH